MINFIDKHAPRKFSSICSSTGVILCEDKGGAFLVLRYKEDVENLKALLDKLSIVEVLPIAE